MFDNLLFSCHGRLHAAKPERRTCEKKEFSFSWDPPVAWNVWSQIHHIMDLKIICLRGRHAMKGWLSVLVGRDWSVRARSPLGRLPVSLI